ncbi:MAG: chorismate mutase [Pseudomonadota bacterium]|nr:chorismate mutase [Pseudomonadota bacterium]
MSVKNRTLASLREEINRIDDAVQDLLIERAAIAENVRVSKSGAAVWRPAREAQILRRLVMRHRGSFPRVTIVQIWREIISSMVRLQGEFSVAIHNPENNQSCREVARDHFGRDTPMALYTSARAVITAVQDGSATVGVLPIPEDSEETPWWPILTGMAGGPAAICARLPFGASVSGSGEEALCVSTTPPEESGIDVSLYTFRTSANHSRAKLSEEIAAAGIKPLRLLGSSIPSTESSLFFAELEGFTRPDDPRIARLLDPVVAAAEDAVFLGAYASPFKTTALKDASSK